MFEVYTGHKPGRPTLLITISAAALAATLCAAWMQVQNRRALGAQVQLDDTPLVVRPPRGWVRDPEDPHGFILPAHYSTWGRDRMVAERKITFLYERLPHFVPPLISLRRDFDIRGKLTELEPARIGPLDGVQLVRSQQMRRGGRVSGDLIIRRACSPRGDQITVLYLPLTELTHADLGLLDDVCLAVKFADAGIRTTAADALRHAGLTFAIPDGGIISGPDFPQIAELTLSGAVNDLPAWAIRVSRTFLAHGRTPRDVLLDLAAAQWNISEDGLRIEESQRGDGARVATIHPRSTEVAGFYPGATIVAADDDAAIIVAFAEPQSAAAADRAREALAADLRFTATDAHPASAKAIENGTRLAAQIATPDALTAAWGMLPERAYFLATGSDGVQVIVGDRAARNRRPEDGYHGFSIQAAKDRSIATTWQLQADGITFTWQREGVEGIGPGAVSTVTSERRRGPDSPVFRTRAVGRESSRTEFEPGPAYVCYPAEELAEKRVAAQQDGAWLIQVSSSETRGPYNRLLRPLPPDASGLRLVLSQDDFDPTGTLLAYDADGRLRSQSLHGWRIESTSPENAHSIYPDLGRLIRLVE